MKMPKITTVILMLFFIILLTGCREKQTDRDQTVPPSAHQGDAAGTIPVKNTITMVDLGADKCVPCKMMAPILAELEEVYRGRAAIVFVDVWKDKAPAERFGIRGIPTQIFFDKNGNEVYRHMGFMDKASIVAQLKKMGVE